MRYSQRSRISGIINKADAKVRNRVKSAQGMMMGAKIADLTVQELDKLFRKKKDKEKLYKKAEEFLASKNFAEKPLMPSFNDFMMDRNVNFKIGESEFSIPDLEVLFDADDPKKVELSKMLIDLDTDNFIKNIRKTLDLK